MDVNLPYVSLVFPVDKYDDRILRCFSSFLTYFKYRKIDNWIVVGNLNDKEEYIINNYSHKYGIRNLHIIKTGCNKSYEELSKIGISFGFNDSEICYVSDFKTEITKQFNPGVLINILNREQNVRSIRLTGKDYKKIGKCNYKILKLTDRFSYDGNYLIKNCNGNDLIVDFKVDGIKSIEIKQIIKEESKKSIIETKKPIIEQIPYVNVLMTTHNRTNVACAVIDSLIKNIKYPKLKWCISDDRSDEGHVEKLVEQFKKNGINEVHVEKTNKERCGLGASLNNGLKYAWTNSDIVLTTEDDWILEKELKLAHYVDIINKNNDIGGIRLATMNYAIANKRSGHKGFYIVESDGKYKTSVFNNQVMLRHKRTYDKIGYYKENCSGDVSEIDEIKKFNNQKGLAVLYPDFIKQNCMDDSSMYFIHVGKSVSGHERYGVPERYQWIYGYIKYDVIVSLTSFPSRLQRFDLMKKCLDSLVNQVTKYQYKIVITICNNDKKFIQKEMYDYCCQNNIEILYCDYDIKGHKKYFYVMQKYTNFPIITVDDDLIFYDNLVESLMDKHIEQPNVIWSGWVQKLNLSEDGTQLVYNPMLHSVTNSEIPSFKYKFGSGSGTLFPANLIYNYDNLLKLITQADIILHDELVLKKLAIDRGFKVGLCINKKYINEKRIGWYIHTQFILDEIQPLVESNGNLHAQNCQIIQLNNKRVYRGMITEQELLGKYIFDVNDNFPPVQK